MKKAIFLDRDGVINKRPAEHDYVKTWSEFELLPDVLPALKVINNMGFLAVVISNQRGVGRGLMTKDSVDNIHTNLQRILFSNNIFIDAIYYCPHRNSDNCSCRKPLPGLLFKASLRHKINMKDSWFIGDSDSDVLCGELAGVPTLKIPTDSSLLNAVAAVLDLS